MKKLIAVTAILSVMFLGAGTSQALMSVPDAVPGRDILIPFFLVSMTGTGGSDNTLITVTDVQGVGRGTEATDPMSLHLKLMDIDSVIKHDKPIKITPYDVYVIDALTLINGMSPTDRDALEIDFDNDGDNDHWAGYIHFENMTSSPGNDFMAHVYQVSALDGLVAGYTGVSLEAAIGGGSTTQLVGYADATLKFNQVEAISANGLYSAKLILAGGTGADAMWLRLLPRYYIHDLLSTNVIIIWTDVFDGTIPPNDKLTDPEDIALPGSLHVNFYDQEETVLSSTITIDHELTFIHVASVIPDGLKGTDPYAAGWIDITTPDIQGAGYNDLAGDRYLLGYSLQRAMMDSGTTLDVIFEAHRDAGTGLLY